MSFIRPAAQAHIMRWREVLIGGALMALGTYWALGVGQLLGWVGVVVIIVGSALCVIGVQRSRFRIGGDGPGVVRVDEGQIAYFGPLTGGAIATSELERLVLDSSAKPAHWVLDQPGQSSLHIPVTAEGADALFDVFSALPGLKTERLLSEMKRNSALPQVIWERTPTTIPHNRLH